MPFVVDPSFAAAWFLQDEANPVAEAIARRLGLDTAVVPTLFRHELRNLLVVAYRRGRLTEALLFEQSARAERFAFEEHFVRHAHSVVRLALQHKLTSYDATYLDLAQNLGLELASNDKDLLAAARQEGVKTITALV